MKLSKIVDPQYQMTLSKLAAQDLPLRTAFKLRGIIRASKEELAKYDEVRADALKRLGNIKEDGTLDVDTNGTVKLSEENMKLFVSELNALLVLDVNVGKIKIDELGDKATLTTNELMALEDLIVE
jgi:hypothetical protein